MAVLIIPCRFIPALELGGLLYRVFSFCILSQRIIIKGTYMKKNSANVSATHPAATQQLQCNVVVEPSSIDFLNEGSVFVAGSSSDCSMISPLPEPKKSKRRSQASGKR